MRVVAHQAFLSVSGRISGLAVEATWYTSGRPASVLTCGPGYGRPCRPTCCAGCPPAAGPVCGHAGRQAAIRACLPAKCPAHRGTAPLTCKQALLFASLRASVRTVRPVAPLPCTGTHGFTDKWVCSDTCEEACDVIYAQADHQARTPAFNPATALVDRSAHMPAEDQTFCQTNMPAWKRAFGPMP